jgi:HD-GYP domain-containing protein (c-di-GMP phosphodiesterase class II)
MGTVSAQLNSSTGYRNVEDSVLARLKLSFAKLAANRPAQVPQAQEPTALTVVPRRVVSSRDLYSEACDYLTQVFEAVRSRRPVAWEFGEALISEMVSSAKDSEELFISALHVDEPQHFAVRHSVNVAIYALRMANDLEFDPEQQVKIGLAGLLHDVGMVLIPEPIVYKQAPLTEAELKALQERPNLSFKILQDLGSTGAAIAETAAQVYERLDGSGYPHGLQGEEIQEFAKVIGLLDLYEALVHSRPNRERLSFFEAVKYIFKSCKAQFERHYIKSLLRVFTVFPLHSCVELNSGAFGQVIETHPDQPMRPRLRVLMDAQHRKVLAERIIDLPAESLLHIVRSVSKKEIQELLQGQTVGHAGPEPDCDTMVEPVM